MLAVADIMAEFGIRPGVEMGVLVGVIGWLGVRARDCDDPHALGLVAQPHTRMRVLRLSIPFSIPASRVHRFPPKIG